jgi:transcriptional regulator with XRE-family HTH domain
MIIADRLQALRKAKHLSQGDIEKRTGLLRCYISRVENGHTVPALETLEKFAHAMDVPLYELFHDGKKPLEAPHLTNEKNKSEDVWGSAGKDAHVLRRFRSLLGRIKESDRKLLLHMASKMVRPAHQRVKKMA